MSFYDLTKEERIELVKIIENSIKEDLLDNQVDNTISLASDDDIHIRKNTYLAIGRIYRDIETLRDKAIGLLQNLYSNKNEKVRQTVVYALGEIGKINSDSIIDMLEDALFDSHHSVHIPIIGVLKQMGEKNPKSALDFAKKFLSHPDPKVRCEIIHGIEFRGRTHPEDILPLLSGVQNDSDKKVQETIIRVLGQIGCKKDCFERVVGALNCWENKEIVEKGKNEIYEIHKKNNEFSDKSYDINQFEFLLERKTIGKSSNQRRSMRKYYRDLYKLDSPKFLQIIS